MIRKWIEKVKLQVEDILDNILWRNWQPLGYK